jgi:hypothetical protein
MQDAGTIGTSPPLGTNLIGTDVNNWLKGMGGAIGSGIEGGIVQMLSDLWSVVVGPLEVLLGVLIGMWVLVIYFKNDLMNIARIAAIAAV